MRTIFLDRDGVINKKAPANGYVTDWTQFEMLPGVREAMGLVRNLGYRTIVITNQRSIARGLSTMEQQNNIHRRMAAEIAEAGGRVDAVYVCPHHVNSCRCRKPELGLFWRARAEFPDIEFPDAWMIGDSLSDIEAGRRLGAQTILIGHIEPQPMQISFPKPDYIASSLLEAVQRYITHHTIQTLNADKQ